MITAVSAAGNVSPAKIAAASPARNSALAMPLAAAFSLAKRTLLSLISMPVTRSNAGADDSAKSPLPQ